MLMAVSGIGEVTADRIIAYRDRVGVISNMDMLLEVNGIGDSTLALLKGYFYVDSADYHDMPQETKPAETRPVQTEIPADTITEPPATEEQTVTTTETTEKVRQKVNINKADAQEISDKLLIDMDKANAVIELRDLISYYESPNELLLCKGFTENLFPSFGIILKYNCILYICYIKKLAQFRASLFCLIMPMQTASLMNIRSFILCSFDTLTATAPSSNIVNAAPAPKPVLGDLSPSLFTF